MMCSEQVAMPSSGLAWILPGKRGNHRITAPWDSELVFCFCSFCRLFAHLGQCYVSGKQTTSRKKLSFPMAVFLFDFFFFFTFFLGNTNFGLDGEFLALLCGFKQVAICPS